MIRCKKLILSFLLRSICLIALVWLLSFSVSGQNINGQITYKDNNLTIVKLWGTHEQRGFAYGYLMHEGIVELYDNYIKPQFGTFLTQARQVIADGVHISIDSIYIVEAKAVVAGIDSALGKRSGLDYLDVLVANSFLDLQGISKSKVKLGLSNGCSSLISWGSATLNTQLNGNMVISRHLDWTPNSYLLKNQVVAIHLPSEVDEQPWLLIGFSGQISVLSGFNNRGLNVYQHMMSDFSGSGLLNQHYEPVWFTLRKAIERYDYNNDGFQNVNDLRDAFMQHAQGTADGFIISAACKLQVYDSLTALVAELAPLSPKITFRTNSFADSIPSDNLYAANYEIKRNNHYHFCSRYNAVVGAITNGLNVSKEKNWEIMRDYSNSSSHNIQFMQVMPEERIFNISYHNSTMAAYQRDSLSFNIDDLFDIPVHVKLDEITAATLKVFPNPTSGLVKLAFYNEKSSEVLVELVSVASGKLVWSYKAYYPKGEVEIPIDNNSLSGFYICKIRANQNVQHKKILIMKVLE